MTLRFSQTVIGRPKTIDFIAEATKPGCTRVSWSTRRPRLRRRPPSSSEGAPRQARKGETPASRACSMPLMSRLPLVAVAGAACAALALPAFASAEIIEIGKIDPAPVPSCPTRPCLAVSRTTGYQAKIGPTRGVMTIPKDGSIVAWTIGLGKPGKKQTTFFNDKLGGESQAQLTILNPRRKLRSRAVGQGDPQKLTPFFGSTVQFPLAKSIPVKKGWIVALTVPTWAPALAVGLGADTSWRASRGKGTCEDTSTNTVQTQPNQLAQYYCLYKTARLAYSATLVTSPTPAAATPPATTRRQRALRGEALDAPAVAGALVAQAIVQAPRAALPQLDALGAHEEAAPVRGARDLGAREALLDGRDGPLELLARGDDLALRRRPRADPRGARARGEVGVALGLGQALGVPSTRTERWTCSQPKVSAA